jgi:hypothetical protein
VPFDTRFWPPAAVEPATVRNGGDAVDCTALIDTGASLTILPDHAIPSSAEPDGWVLVHFGIGEIRCPRLKIVVAIFGCEVDVNVAVCRSATLADRLGLPADGAASDIPALIGRDVLNATRFVFDGPAGTVTAR